LKPGARLDRIYDLDVIEGCETAAYGNRLDDAPGYLRRRTFRRTTAASSDRRLSVIG
jgi:hypothetical protein